MLGRRTFSAAALAILSLTSTWSVRAGRVRAQETPGGYVQGPAPATPADAPPPAPETPVQGPAAEPASPPTEEAPAPAPSAPPALSAEEEAALAADLTADLAQQVVSGASRTAETAEQAPVAATVVRAEDLRRYNIRTIFEAVRFIAMGTFTTGGQLAGMETIGARGVGVDNDAVSHFLMIVDGSPINQPISGGGIMSLPITMIDSIEVILGPGSVVYGGNAMLGVINIRTKPARQMEGLSALAEYAMSPSQDATGGIDSFSGPSLAQHRRIEATYGKTFHLFDRDGEFTAGFLHSRYMLPNTMIGPQLQYAGAPAAVPTFGGGVLSDYVLDGMTQGYARVRVGNFTADGEYSVGKYLFNVAAPQVMSPENNFDHRIARGNIQQSFAAGTHFTGFTALRLMSRQYTINRLAQICPAGGTAGSRCLTASDNRGMQQQLELQGTWDFLADGRYQLMLGIDGRLRQAGANADQIDQATDRHFETAGGYQSHGQLLGFYTQFRGRPARWLALNFGVRADWIRDAGKITALPSVNPVTYGDQRVVTNSAVSPRAAVMFFPTDSTTLYGTYSRAFRAPAPSENFIVGATVESSNGLKPEIVDSGEIGLKQKIGVHRLILSTFATKWNKMIGLVPGAMPGKTRYDSVGDINNYGANLGLEGILAINRLHYGLNFTYGYARRTFDKAEPSAFPAAVQGAIPLAKDSIEVVGAPEAYGNARIAYDFQGNYPEIALAAAVYGRRLTSFGYANRLLVAPATAMGTATNTPTGGYFWDSNVDPKFTDPMVELRFNVSGKVPNLPALRYHVFGRWLLTEGFEPMAYGSLPGGTLPTVGVPGTAGTVPVTRTSGQLFPATKLTLGLALEVAFGP